jgi:hypothetical protein
MATQASIPMEPVLNLKDGSTDWRVLISGASPLGLLADGTFPLRAAVTSFDGTQVLSAPIQLKITRQTNGLVVGMPKGALYEGDRLAFSGTSTNAKSMRIEYSSPQRVVDEKFQFDPVSGNWTHQSVAGGAGTYQFAVFAVGASDSKPIGIGTYEVLKKGLADAPNGSVSTSANQSASVNQRLTFAGIANGQEPVKVKVIFSEPKTGSQVVENATRNVQGGWSVNRSFPVVGSFGYRAEVVDASGPNPVVIGQGRVDITDSPPLRRMAWTWPTSSQRMAWCLM